MKGFPFDWDGTLLDSNALILKVWQQVGKTVGRTFEKEKFEVKTLEEHRLSVQELGRKLLIENLKEMKLDPKLFENVFELLSEDKIDKALKLLRETY